MTVRTQVDASRQRDLVAGPGTDTRMWLTMARIVELGIQTENDGNGGAGIYADVEFVPDGTHETCLVGGAYVTDDGGLWCPVDEGDMVLVAIPNGDAGNGPVVICRAWFERGKPSKDFVDATDPSKPTQDNVWRLKKGKKLRILSEDGEIILRGEKAGGVLIETTGSVPVKIKSSAAVHVEAPNVLIGPTPGGRPFARIGDMVAVSLPTMGNGAGNVVEVPAVPGTIQAIGQVVSGLESVQGG